MGPLSPVETIALSKAVKESAAKEARPMIADGHHAVDFVVRVSGDMLVAPARPSTVKEDVPPATLLGLVLSTMRPCDLAAVLALVDAELVAWRIGAGDPPTILDDVAEAVAKLLASGHRERPGTKAGTVTAPLAVELVARAVPS